MTASDGRKFLQANAFQYAGVGAQANLQGCNRPVEQTHWVLLSQDERVQLYTPEDETNQMRVLIKSASNFSCDFAFDSAREMVDKTPAAEDLTIAQFTSR